MRPRQFNRSALSLMLEETSRLRLIFLTGLVIGGIGALGQAYLLYHELVHTYPYKIMDYPFYKSIANVGVLFAPFIAVVSGLLFGLKRFWLASIIPVISCPLLFAGVFKTASIVREWNGVVDAGINFDGKTPAMAAQDFFSYTVSLAIVGLIIGGICSFILSRFFKAKKLA